jgi:tetratricopeptide (TPR) repeat protein
MVQGVNEAAGPGQGPAGEGPPSEPGTGLSGLRKATEATPGDAGAHYQYAKALEENGHWDDAQREYRAVTEISPEFGEAYVHYGDMLRKARRTEDAEAQYRKAISLNPADFRAHFSYASMLEEQKRIEEAEDEYVRAACGPAKDLLNKK